MPVIRPALGVSAPWLDWNALGENGDAVRFLLSKPSLKLFGMPGMIAESANGKILSQNAEGEELADVL